MSSSNTLNVSKKVQQYVSHLNKGKPFTLDQVVKKKELPVQQRNNASKALQRMVADRLLVRLSNGTYYRPKESRFGALPLETKEIVKVVTKSKKATVVPAGAFAINALGLDTQLPMVSSYYISVRMRTQFIADSIKFEYKESLQHFSQKFSVKDEEIKYLGLLFWSALTYLDRHTSDLYASKLTNKFTSSMDQPTQDRFLSALPPSMKWAKEILKTNESLHRNSK